MVVLNESGGKVDRSNLVTRRDVKKTSRSVAEENKEKSFGDFGSRMLEQMGWRTGQSLGLDGDSGAHIVDPVTVSCQRPFAKLHIARTWPSSCC